MRSTRQAHERDTAQTQTKRWKRTLPPLHSLTSVHTRRLLAVHDSVVVVRDAPPVVAPSVVRPARVVPIQAAPSLEVTCRHTPKSHSKSSPTTTRRQGRQNRSTRRDPPLSDLTPLSWSLSPRSFLKSPRSFLKSPRSFLKSPRSFLKSRLDGPDWL